MKEQGIIDYPEWYRVERATEKIIKKLVSLQELHFYLRNPNEYIRRLAILRINELKLEDALDTLEEILEDPLESDENKKLAAWTIKTICQKWQIDLFISNPLVTKFTGEESYHDLYQIVLKEPGISFNFQPSSSLLLSELQQEKDYTDRDQEVNIEIAFYFFRWFQIWSSELVNQSKKNLLKLPTITAAFLLKLFKLIWTKVFWRLTEKFSSYAQNLYYRHKQKFNPVFLVKNAIFYFLYIIFFPVRLVRHHKKLTLSFIIFVYCFLAFTEQGNIITYRYFGFDLLDLQTHLFIRGKKLTIYTWYELKKNWSIWLKQVKLGDMFQNIKNFLAKN